MEELVFNSERGTPVTNSLLVAQKFGKRNADVLRDIRNLYCSENFRQRNFALMVEMKELPQGGATKTEYYIMTKDGFSFLVMGYTGKEAGQFKEDFIDAFNKMEETIKTGGFQLPQTFSEALMLAARQAEELETQQKQLKAAAPKVEYFDNVLQSTSTHTMTQVAKELGMTAIALEKKLHEAGVMFKQSGQWFLYAKYQDKGYTMPRTHHYTQSDGTSGTNTITVWTEAGREFIHSLFDSKLKTA
jgi:Rha family phage regulatory protein